VDQFFATVRQALFIPIAFDGLVVVRSHAGTKSDSQEWLSH
jgi:hypothetical protein